MAKEKKYMLIEEETLREMLQTRFQQTYALVLLSHICLKHNLDTSLTMAGDKRRAAALRPSGGRCPQTLSAPVSRNRRRTIVQCL